MILSPAYLPGKPEPTVTAKSKSFSKRDVLGMKTQEPFEG